MSVGVWLGDCDCDSVWLGDCDDDGVPLAEGVVVPDGDCVLLGVSVDDCV